MIEITKERIEQLEKINQKLIKVFPELKDYNIKLKYEDLDLKKAYAQITSIIVPGKFDPLESLKKAKFIFKTYILKGIIISFNKKILDLRGAIRKDVLYFLGSHELTHFLELPKYLSSRELGIDFNAHSSQFYETQKERYNQFKSSRNEEPVEDIKQFEQIINLTVNQIIEEKKPEGQILNKNREVKK